jgi:hypothetical protein
MKRLALILILLLTLPCGAVLHRYVDTDVSGGSDDGTSWANAWGSADDWLDWEVTSGTTDLVTATETIIVHLRGDALDTLTSDGLYIISSDFTTNSTYKIYLDVAEEDRHEGARSTGYRISSSHISSGAIHIDGVYVDVNGISVTNRA